MAFKMIQDVFNNMKSFNISFSAYIGFCFNDRVLGIWQGGSGMALTGEEPFVPNCGAQVTASDMAQCDADGIKCRDCYEIKPCTDCQYWPLYPCYSPVRPMAHCIAEYTNDPIAVGQADPINYSTGLYMYERSVQEGHDADGRDGTLTRGRGQYTRQRSGGSVSSTIGRRRGRSKSRERTRQSRSQLRGGRQSSSLPRPQQEPGDRRPPIRRSRSNWSLKSSGNRSRARRDGDCTII